jgi:hypothetical protein
VEQADALLGQVHIRTNDEPDAQNGEDVPRANTGLDLLGRSGWHGRFAFF